MDDRKAERFGRYEILTELGRGAMGVVYKARDPKINRVVAVKTISLAGQSPQEESEYRERFLREAEAAGRLSHPGIVTIFDVGEEPETRSPYIVMEFVGGQSLEHLLSRGDHKLPVKTALQLTLELAEALDCAHGQGVVHRDLKPSNILLTEDGHAKIADFGVAKLNLANHTLAGRALGTPAYMSPEQLNGDAVDGRSDLFSLGVVLYTILTGYRPFQGNSAMTVSFKVVNKDPIPATLLDTDLPPGLDYIIQRAMAKEPAERYQRGMEMVLDIQHLQQGREPWSKAKLPGSNTRRGGPEGAHQIARSALGEPRIAARLLAMARSLRQRPGRGDSDETPEGKRTQLTFSTRAAVAFGLVVLGFGLWAATFGLRGALRTAGPVPSVTEPVPDKSAPDKSGSDKTASDKSGFDKAAAPASAANTTAAMVSGAPIQTARIVVGNPAANSVANSAGNSASRHTGNSSQPAATLVIEVDHKFADAQLSLWVDDRLAYTQRLAATSEKRLVVFNHVEGHELHSLQIPSGKHRLRVRVASGSATADRSTSGQSSSDQASSGQSGTLAGDFPSDRQSVLRINFSKRGEMNLVLQQAKQM
ncbi:MAG TPA: protein kinase [Terriglobales bacterium]|nr:protein kinase [Terriglobales bacterium]